MIITIWTTINSIIYNLSELIVYININSFNDRQRKLFNKIFNDNKIFSFKGKIFLHDGSWTIYYIFLCQWRHWEITSNKNTIPPFDKTLMSHSSPPNQPRVLLLAPTGTAAVNIVGTAIHSLSEVYRSS